jgi:hypothetical protein
MEQLTKKELRALLEFVKEYYPTVIVKLSRSALFRGSRK